MLKIGATRIVLVFPWSTVVYKVGRIRPLKTVAKAFVIIVSSRHYYALQEKYDARIGVALWRYLLAGIYANRSEHAYWIETADSRCAPIWRSYWGGLVITQTKLAPVSLIEVMNSPLHTLLSAREIGSAHQYGRDASGQILLLDYASTNGVQETLWGRLS